MSHQTGIKANEELLKIFAKAKSAKYRLIKVSIVKEQLTCTATNEVRKSWEVDYDCMIPPLIERDVPCYILFRLDAKTPLGHAWLLLSWVPDTASIRQKMLYASTKATLKKEFGSAHITEELHATTIDEATFAGYQRQKTALAAPAPLTAREEELVELRKTEVNPDIGANTRHQTFAGVACPMTDAAKTAVLDLLHGKCDYLQFCIDIEGERIDLVKSAKIALNELSKQVPDDHARYHLYVFRHTYEGDYQIAFVFIYSMPGYSCPVRERMMYSSCKAPFLEQLQTLGITVSKKLEIDDGSELTEDFLQEELHPRKSLNRQAFAKPKGPPNRGARRLTRPTNEDL